MKRYKDKKKYLLSVIRDMIAREAETSEEADELAWHIAYFLRGTQWERRKTLMKARVATNENITFFKQQLFVLRNACSRAKLFGLPADLDIQHWLKTLEYFNHKCAYCSNRPYQVLEHFIPLDMRYPDGGTTLWNCVPACRSCNNKKRHMHPDLLMAVFSEEVINKVRSYLQQFQ